MNGIPTGTTRYYPTRPNAHFIAPRALSDSVLGLDGQVGHGVGPGVVPAGLGDRRQVAGQLRQAQGVVEPLQGVPCGFQPSETSTPWNNGRIAMSSNAFAPRFSWQSKKVSKSVHATRKQNAAPEMRAEVSSAWRASWVVRVAFSRSTKPDNPAPACAAREASQPVDTGAPHTWASISAARATGRCWPATR
jgi:hypothetical protein